MGVVYLMDDSVLRRTVAVKVVLGGRSANAEASRRFLAEARSMAAVEHPNVTHVYAFGEVDGRPYIAMEYVRGQSLATRLKRGPLPLEEACRIVRETALGLSAAWERRLIHRDVKPSNILLDAHGRVHLADFGLAQSIDTSDEGLLIRAGAGTPHYMSPEQARGADPLDFRTDIYSLGIVFWELLSGVRPFSAPTTRELIHLHLNAPLPPVKSSLAKVPESIARLLAWMTQKEPAARPGSYAALIEALDAAVPPRPATLKAPPWWPLADTFRRAGDDRTLLLVWGAVVTACGLSGVANVAWTWSAIPVAVGQLALDFTFYPAFPVSILCAIWLGPSWGAVPLYMANLLGAVYGGVPLPLAVAFAAAGAIEVLILWGLLVTLDVDPDLGRWRDLLGFAGSVAVAAVVSSTSVIVWNASKGYDFSTGQRFWYGWVLGDVLQALVLAAPLLRRFGPTARSWIRGRLATEPRGDVTYARVVQGLMLILAILVFLVFAGFEMMRRELERELAFLGPAELRRHLLQMQLFMGVLVLALVAATGLVSTTLARKGAAGARQPQGRS